MEWASANADVGNGSEEVIEVEPGQRVTNKLDFGMDNPATATISAAAATAPSDAGPYQQ